MIPAGYMAKRIPSQRPDWLAAPAVQDIYSVSACVNGDVLDAPRWEQNGYGLFNSPKEIHLKAANEKVDLQGTHLFYYETHELEFDGETWSPVVPDEGFETHVEASSKKHLEGFDVVSDCDGPNAHSPLSCNGIAADVSTNEHCLFRTKEEALASLTDQIFKDGEPGPYKIYAVYSVAWQES